MARLFIVVIRLFLFSGDVKFEKDNVAILDRIIFPFDHVFSGGLDGGL